MKRLKILLFVVSLACFTGCSGKSDSEETTPEAQIESGTEDNTDLSIEDEETEKKDDEEAISKDILDENGNIIISNSEIESVKATGEATLYNITDKTKAFDYKVPEGYEVLNFTGNQIVVKHIESGVPYYVEVIDGAKEEFISKLEDEMKAENSYIRNCSFDLSRDLSLSGFNCIAKRKNDFYDAGDPFREYSTYCFADCGEDTIQLRVAEDIDYLIPKDVAIEDYVAPETVTNALTNLDYVLPFYEELLTGVSF